MGSFLFKWPHPEANDVHVTGTFDDWGKSVQLDKVGEIWQKDVELPKADEKILYKFVVNDQWIIDPEAPQEDDGHGNINNVLHPEQIKPKASAVPEAFTTSSAAPESTTAALAGEVPLEPKREATEVTPASDSHLHGAPGAFPETPVTEPDSFGVNPLPPSEGASNPVNVPAGEKMPPLSEVTSNSIHSAVTTSQEAYEKGGTGMLGGALAALGLGGTAAKKENLIPESSLPMGENADKSLDASPFISSSGPSTTTADLAAKVPLEDTKAQATTSAVPETVKESIAEAQAEPEATTSSEAVKEKAEVEQELLKKVPENEATGEHAPNIAAAATGAAADAAATPASGVPEQVKESIAEAHAEPEAATSAEAVKEKSEVEQELLKKVPEHDEAGEPAPTIAAATSATAPAPTGETSSTPAPGQLPTAAAAVADGTDGTAELSEAPKTTVVPEETEGDNTEYAPPHAPSAAPGVSNSAAAAVSDGAEDPTLLDEPAVQLGIKNDTEHTTAPSTEPAAAHDATTIDPRKEAVAAVPAAKEAETKAAAPAIATAPTSNATTTPAKPASTTPSSTPGSAKDKKKKHRVSSFFKKIFD